MLCDGIAGLGTSNDWRYYTVHEFGFLFQLYITRMHDVERNSLLPVAWYLGYQGIVTQESR